MELLLGSPLQIVLLKKHGSGFEKNSRKATKMEIDGYKNNDFRRDLKTSANDGRRKKALENFDEKFDDSESPPLTDEQIKKLVPARFVHPEWFKVKKVDVHLS